MTTRLWGRPSWPARKLLSPQSALDVCLSCTGGQSIFFLFLLSMPPLKGETVDPISEVPRTVDPATIFCPPTDVCLLHQPDYLLLFLLSMPPLKGETLDPVPEVDPETLDVCLLLQPPSATARLSFLPDSLFNVSSSFSSLMPGPIFVATTDERRWGSSSTMAYYCYCYLGLEKNYCYSPPA